MSVALSARAEDKGISFNLSYVRGYSNTGPNDAHGTAHYWPTEGVALVEVHALPEQPGGNMYAAWVVNTKTGDAMRLGIFNTTNAGEGTVDVTFNSGVPAGANAIIVTLQHPSDPAAAPTAQRLLVGFFTVPSSQNSSASGNGTSVATLPSNATPMPSGHGQTTGGFDKNGRPIVSLLPQTGGGRHAHRSQCSTHQRTRCTAGR